MTSDSEQEKHSAFSLKKAWILFHIFVITGFSFSFLYSLLGAHPQFFVAHDSGPGDIGMLIAVVSVAIPLALTGVTAVALWPVSRLRARHVVVPLAGSFMLLSLFLVKHVGLPSTGWAWTVASLSALTLTLLYLKLPVFRSFVSLMSAALILLPLSFALSSEIRPFILPPSQVDHAADEISPETPVVWLVFDELPLSSLLDRSMEIDATLFPNFTRLAARSYWFRQATTAYMDTEQSLAAAMSGSFIEDVDQRAWLAHIPQNVFTVLGPGRTVIAHEAATGLCPPEMRTSRRVPWRPRVHRMLGDLAVVTGHLLLPDPAAAGVPEIADRWADFRVGSNPREERGVTRSRSDGLFEYLEYMGFGRIEIFETSLADIPDRTSSLLYFHHMIFPHVPYQFFPDGRYYSYGNAQLEGARSEVWGSDDYLVELGFQRHLLQVGYADRLLGQLLDRLEATEVLESAVVVVMADHGAAFRTGQHRRASRAAIEDIAPVPLFIKLPGQAVGVVSDEPVQTVDVMPTVLSLLGTDSGRGMDGRALLDAQGPINGGPSSQAIYTPTLEKVDLPGDLPARLQRAVLRKEGIFGQEPSWDSLRVHHSSHAEMLGQPLDRFVVSKDQIADAHWTQRVGSSSDPDWIPALIEGRGPRSIEGDVAIFVDGVAQAIVPLRDQEGTRFFSALLPAGAFGPREPNIEVFLVRQGDDALHLDRLGGNERKSAAPEYALDLRHPDGPRIRLAGGHQVRLIPGELTGFVDGLSQGDEHTHFAGWAAEPAARQPATRVLLFVNGDYLLSTVPWVQRSDVARAVFESDHPADVGFATDLPMRAFPRGLRGELRAYAVNGQGAASELGNALGSPCEPSTIHSVLWPPHDLAQEGARASLVYDDGTSTPLEVPSRSFLVPAPQERDNCIDLDLKLPPGWDRTTSATVLLYQDGHFIQARELSEILALQKGVTNTETVAITVAEKRLLPSAERILSVVLLAEDGKGVLIQQSSGAAD